MSANQMADQNQQHQNGGVGQKRTEPRFERGPRMASDHAGHGGTSKHLPDHSLDFEGCSDKVDALAAPRWSIIVHTIGRLFFFLHL